MFFDANGTWQASNASTMPLEEDKPIVAASTGAGLDDGTSHAKKRVRKPKQKRHICADDPGVLVYKRLLDEAQLPADGLQDALWQTFEVELLDSCGFIM